MEHGRRRVSDAGKSTRSRLHGIKLLGRPLPLMLIIAEKAIVAVVLAAAAVVAFVVRGRVVDPLHLLFADELTEDPHDVYLHWVISHAPHLTTYVGPWVAVALALWCLLYAVEGIGLWRERTWAELLVIVETASFLPIEIWDLVKKFHLLSLGTLIVNLAVLLYVVYFYRRTHPRRHPTSP